MGGASAAALTRSHRTDTLEFMSLLRLRRWSRVVSVVLLCAAAGGLPHFAADDPGCLIPVESFDAHEETQHVVRAAGAVHTADHCAICHWTRSLRSPRAGSVPVGAAPLSSATLLRLQPPVHPAPVMEHLPARAPPALL